MYTSIVILTYNNLEYTKLCINSIRNYTQKDKYELIVVDNHSTDGTVEWLSQQKDIRVICNNENVGFSKGCNQGIEIAKGDSILFLNNDTIVTSNWLTNLQKCLYSNPDIGGVGAVTNNAFYYQTIAANYKSLEEMQLFALANNFSSPDKWEERLKLIGFCMLIKKEVIEKVGLFDERFTPALYEDADYCARIRNAGFKLMLCRDVFIHHFGFASFKSQEEYDTLLKVNSDKFEEKWGYNPGYSTNIRYEIVELMDSPKEVPIRVLEVGCACGGTLLCIKQKYPHAELYGIELNEHAAKAGGSFAKIIAANIEDTVLPYTENYFDYIILADVLEHLQNPWRALETLYKYLAPNGKFLASVPNIMHVSIIRGLMNGCWTYEDSGILDRTHLRFFTLHEIQKMFTAAGFSNVEYIAKQKVTEDDNNFIAQLPIGDRSLVDQFTVFQYLAKAKKDSAAGLQDVLVAIERQQDVDKNIILLNKYDINSVIEHINTSQNAVQLFNVIAVTNFKEKCFDYVIPYLQAALQINSQDSNTLYNLAYILYQMQEFEQALAFIDIISNKDEQTLQLVNKIKTKCK